MPKVVPVVTVEQISGIYGFHPNTIRSWLKKGLKYYRKGPGGKISIPIPELILFLKKHYATSVTKELPREEWARRSERGLRIRTKTSRNPEEPPKEK